jgi:hypothetical protein
MFRGIQMRTPGFTLSRISLLLFSWCLIIIGPHFLEGRELISLLFGGFLFIMNMRLISAIIEFGKVSLKKLEVYYLSLSVLLGVIILLTLNNLSAPYLLFSRLGSYTMFLDDSPILFGDLVHLTSAATCENSLVVGTVVCDPWGRVFNQNPQVVNLLKFLSIHNSNLFGFFILLFCLIAVFLVLRQIAQERVAVWVLMLSPPIVLAVDRGNEILTLGLVCCAMYMFSRGLHPLLATAPLMLAGVFKFWPFLIVIFLAFFRQEFSKWQRSILVFSSLFYLLWNTNNLYLVSKFTEVGDSFGGSFGFVRLDFGSIYSYVILCSAIVTAYFMQKTSVSKIVELGRDDLLQGFTLSLMACYTVLFFSGSHFTYRLIVLIPLVVLLSRSDSSNFLISFIFVTLFMSRFSIVLFSTLTLALVFGSIIVSYFRVEWARTSPT